MRFAEWLQDNEEQLFNEGLGNHPLTQRVIGYIQKYLAAGKGEADDLKMAAMIVRSRLKAMLGDGSQRPSEEQMRMALGTILRMPKLGTVLLPLISPIPGTTLALMILNLAFKKALGVTILPRHFDQAFMGPNTTLGKLAARPARQV